MATDKKTRVANVVVFVLSVILVALLCFAVTSKAEEEMKVTPLTEWTPTSITIFKTFNKARYILVDESILCIQTVEGGISCDWENIQSQKKEKLVKKMLDKKKKEE